MRVTAAVVAKRMPVAANMVAPARWFCDTILADSKGRQRGKMHLHTAHCSIGLVNLRDNRDKRAFPPQTACYATIPE